MGKGEEKKEKEEEEGTRWHTVLYSRRVCSRSFFRGSFGRFGPGPRRPDPLSRTCKGEGGIMAVADASGGGGRHPMQQGLSSFTVERGGPPLSVGLYLFTTNLFLG